MEQSNETTKLDSCTRGDEKALERGHRKNKDSKTTWTPEQWHGIASLLFLLIEIKQQPRRCLASRGALHLAFVLDAWTADITQQAVYQSSRSYYR